MDTMTEVKSVSKNLDMSRLIKLMGLTSEKMELNSLMHGGNDKIPTSTAIFSMGSAHDCPSRKLGFCQAINGEGKNCCYAMKAEYSYHPDVLPYRRRQEKFWKKITASQFVTQFIIINSFKPVPFKALRLNESGDFHSQACVDKAEEIARHLAKYKVKVYCYTARKDLDFSKVRNLVILGSNFHKVGMRGTFKMVLNKKDKPSGYGICKGDCRVCNRCLVGRNTVILKH